MMRAIAIAAAVGCAGHAAAQDKKAADREREQLRRMQAAQQKLQAEKTQLETEKAELTKKLAESEAKAGAAAQAEARARGTGAKASADLDKLKAEKSAQDAKLAEAQAAIQDLNRKLADSGKAFATRDAEAKTLQTQFDRESKSLAACEVKNLKLYEYGTEVLEKYRTKGVWDAVLQQGDGLTRIKDVEIYNVVQEYRDKFDSQKIEAPKK